VRGFGKFFVVGTPACLFGINAASHGQKRRSNFSLQSRSPPMRQEGRAAPTDNHNAKTVPLSRIVYRHKPSIPRSIVDLRIRNVFGSASTRRFGKARRIDQRSNEVR
jgi:hypothetical protein